MNDTFTVTVYEGLVLDVPNADWARFTRRNPLYRNPLVSIRSDAVSWSSDTHTNVQANDPHPWLTVCIRSTCRTKLAADGPGICPTCIADLGGKG